MLQRKQLADLAKGIAVLLMIQVHLIEVFAKQSVYDSLLGQISLFLGGPLVAPVFLIILGYFLASSKKTISQLVVRGFAIFIIGLLLNIGLNLNLFFKINAGLINVNKFDFLFGVDILAAAGISIIVIAIFKYFTKEKQPYIFYLSSILALLIAALTPYLNTLLVTNNWWGYILAYIGGNYNWSYFPLFPWLAYTFAGYSFFYLRGKIYLESNSFKKFHLLGIISLFTIFVIFSGIQVFPEIVSLEHYYHHNLILFLWILSFVLFWFILLSQIERDFGKSSLLLYIKWIGKNVTIFYIIQWLIIGNIGTSIYKSQNLSELIIWFSLILVTVSILTYTKAILVSRFNQPEK